MRFIPILFALLTNACLLIGCGLAGAATPEQQMADRIAKFVQGRLVIEGLSIYRAAKVAARIEGGELSLRIDADPLYKLEQRPIRFNSHGGTTLYEDFLPSEAKCGLSELRNRIDGTHISVKTGEQFLNLREALEGMFAELPSFQSSNVAIVISDADLRKIRACAKGVAARADAIPFDAIRIYSGDSLLTELARTSEQSWFYERGLGDDQATTRIRIEPKSTHTEKFSVEVQAVSVMHCDYEGPHIELDNWKQGLSPAKALRSKGRDFFVDQALLSGKPPEFPSYTRTELRQAIRAHFGQEGLASVEEAKPCAPFLRGHIFIVKYGPRVVQKISIYHPGGC